MKPTLVSKELMQKIISTREPLGLFLCQDVRNNQSITLHGEVIAAPIIKWIAVDNSTGEAWTEEFDTEESALVWVSKPVEPNNIAQCIIDDLLNIAFKEISNKITNQTEEKQMNKIEDFKKNTVVKYGVAHGVVEYVEPTNGVVGVEFDKVITYPGCPDGDFFYFGGGNAERLSALKIISEHEEKTMDIKQELHKLVDNLDLSLITKNHGYFTDVIVLDMVKVELTKCQKEPTLEDKLLKAGFVKEGIYYRKKNTYLQIFKKWIKIQHSVLGMDDAQLTCDINNHDQIFADIAYLEQKYGAKHD